MKTLESIVVAKSLPVALEVDWNRQFLTAKNLVERFENGYHTQLLADEVGMGKTYVAMAVMAQHVFQTEENDRKVLLVVPNNHALCSKWEQELRSFNQQYLGEEVRSYSKRLQPMIVNDYWDLIENLHDFENQPLPRITESMSQCMVLMFHSWWWIRRRRAHSRDKHWAAVGDMNDHDWVYLDFCSRFSRRAFHEYLDRRSMLDPSGMDSLGKDLETGKSGFGKINGLFRGFAAEQDSNEANVFVMRMSTLGKPRIDHKMSKLFNAWIVSKVMNGRHGSTWSRVAELLQKENLITGNDGVVGEYSQWLFSLKRCNLWSMSNALDRAIEKRDGSYAVYTRLTSPDTCRSEIKALHSAVVQEKLQEAAIGLAVVDEAHNWKNGGNGAMAFQESYAPYIERKLLLSATPFQLHQDELEKIYLIADGGVNGSVNRSLETVQDLLKNGLAKECLSQSEAFHKVWISLGHSEAAELAEWVAHGKHTEMACTWTVPTGFGETVTGFLGQFCRYAQAVQKLQLELGKVMIRHIKDRSHRHFHAGRDFLAEGTAAPEATPRSHLYVVDGFADPKHALMGYLGMRLVQKLQGQNGTGNARLLRGITSSIAAFQESNRETLQSDVDGGEVQAYLGFFNQALLDNKHPKVEATTQRAFHNFLRGHKTLIFCERVPTLMEIEKNLVERIEKLFEGRLDVAMKRRKNFMTRTGFVDMYWSRSFLATCGPVEAKRLMLLWTQRQESTVDHLVENLKTSGVRVTERRLGRLADLEFMRLLEDSEIGWVRCLQNLIPEEIKKFVEGSIVGDSIDPDEPEDHPSLGAEARDLAREVVSGFLTRPCLWFHPEAGRFHQELQRVLEAERQFLDHQCAGTESRGQADAFFPMLTDLVQGMRKILLRPELFAEGEAVGLEFEPQLMEWVWERPAAKVDDGSQWSRRTPGGRLTDFLEILAGSEGSIQRRWTQDSKRKSLWRGVFLKQGTSAGLVLTLQGDVTGETRGSRCAAFNSPLAPDILICTAIGAEGIDLHRFCAEVIHHDLPWNPAKLEQRIGRIDRVGSLVERERVGCPAQKLLVGIPFLANDYEKFQYTAVQKRAQRFVVLLGKPDFSLEIEEEEGDDGVIRELGEEEVESTGPSGGVLPMKLLGLLQMNLQVV